MQWRSAAFVAIVTLSMTVGADDAMRLRIEAQQSQPDRHRFDLPRDAARKPYESFVFLGVEAGMTALDVGAYAGYTTEMFAAAVGPTGRVYSHNTRQVLERYADGYYETTMRERLAGDRLPNTVLHIRPYDDLDLDSEVDVALLGNILHDFYYRDGEDAALRFLRAIHRALKPGGVLGVTDHVGITGRDNARLHRIAPARARALLQTAGFVVDASSPLFANPADDHTLMVYNEAIYRNTDRFFFRAVRPQDR